MWKREQALCVFATKERVPLSGLVAMWGEDIHGAVARKQQVCSFVLLQGDGDGDGDGAGLTVHDLVVAIMNGVGTVAHKEREVFNRDVVLGYCRAHGVENAEPTAGSTLSGMCRKLWELPMDRFVEYALPRLLRDGGEKKELRVLLLMIPCIRWRAEVSGGTCGLNLRDFCGMDEEILDQKATVVEGALADGNLLLSVRLQQAAFEVAERSGPR